MRKVESSISETWTSAGKAVLSQTASDSIPYRLLGIHHLLPDFVEADNLLHALSHELEIDLGFDQELDNTMELRRVLDRR